MSAALVLKLGDRTVRFPSQLGPAEPLDLVQIQNDFREIFNSDAGVNALEYLLRVGHFVEPTHVINDPGGRHSAFQDGQRWMVDLVVAFLTKSPEHIKALVEIMNKQEQE